MNGYSSLGFQNIGPAQWSWIRASLRLAQSRLCSTTPQPLSKMPHPVSHAPPPPFLVPRWCSNRAPFPNHPPPPAIHHPTTQPPPSTNQSFKSLPGPTDTQLRNLSGSVLCLHSGSTIYRSNVQGLRHHGIGCRVFGLNLVKAVETFIAGHHDDLP